MPNLNGFHDASIPATAVGTGWIGARVNGRGEWRIISFIEEMIQEAHAYQVRAGTIATGLAAQNVIADTSADLCYDAATGWTVIPIQLGMAVRDVATSLTFQAALKGVGAVSTSGTAFAPLPLSQGGAGASNIARVQADTVVVAAELATTTVRIFEYENNLTQAPTTFNAGLQQIGIQAAAAQLQYSCKGPGTIYLQVASTTGQTLWFGHLNVIELLSTAIG